MRQGRMERTENCISLFLVGATAVPGLALIVSDGEGHSCARLAAGA